MESKVGVIGLGTMGAALAENIASRGFVVSVWNRTYEKVTEFVKEHGEASFYAPKTFEDFVMSLEKPRRVIIMVPAGKATDAVLEQLIPALEEGDVIMDGGNSFYERTESIEQKLAEHGIHFLGTGVSGGEEGARIGPSIMPGGTEHAWDAFSPILTAIAAEDFNGGPCVAYMGRGGAGHYVKMVHNGIEYAEMQMLAEAYDILRNLYKLEHQEIAEIFHKWSEGRLGSYLVDISVDVLTQKEDGKPLLELILDKAGQKGTGRWTSEEAIKLGVPVPSITGAVFMRGFSADKSEREKIGPLYPKSGDAPDITANEFVEHLEKALYAARVANHEQGFALLKAADMEYEFGLDFKEITRIWQGGCIIRSKMLVEMTKAFEDEVRSLYYDDFFHNVIVECQKSWRLVVATAVTHSIPMHVIASSLTHYEAYRQARGSANFIQGLRDRFGSHTYERVDKEGSFHTDW